MEEMARCLGVLSHAHWQAIATARSSGSAGSRLERCSKLRWKLENQSRAILSVFRKFEKIVEIRKNSEKL
jgi:hypothetical protein